MGKKEYRIIFITHYTELYGANRSLLNLIEGLSLFGITNVAVVTPFAGKLNDELKAKNIESIIIPFVNETYHADHGTGFIKKIGKFFFNCYVVLRYARRLNISNKTIIHSNASATLIGAYLSYWLKVPHVWHVREFGMDDYKLKYNFGYKYFEYWLNKADAVIAISKSIYRKRVNDCKARIKETIYNGVVFSKQLVEQTSGKINRAGNDKIIFGIIGYLSKEKGQEEAIEAFNLLQRKFENTQLIIAGDGDPQYVAFLKSKVESYKLEAHIGLTGFVKQPDDFYKQIDCLLMCSKSEALGRVTIEAMSKGIPVIGYNNAGTSEIVRDGYNGLLYSDGREELCELMKRIIMNKQMAAEMSDNAIQTVKDNFTIESCSNSVATIYKNILA